MEGNLKKMRFRENQYNENDDRDSFKGKGEEVKASVVQ